MPRKQPVKTSTVAKKTIVADLQRVVKEHELAGITRDFYRKHGKYANHIADHFNSFNELLAAAGVTKHRMIRAMDGARRRAEEDVHLVEEFERQILPYHLKYSRPVDKDIVSIALTSDHHDKDVDPFMMALAQDVIKRRKPDINIFLGDSSDAYEVSKYPHNALDMDAVSRLEYMRDNVLEPIVESCGPKCLQYFMLGNHDFRWFKYLCSHSPQLMGLLKYAGVNMAQLLGLDKLKISLVSKVDIRASSARDINDELQKNYLKLFDGLITFIHQHDPKVGGHSASGHTHRPSITTTGNIHGTHTHNILGSMCRTDAEYVENIDNSVNGFGWAWVDLKRRSVYQESFIITKDTCVIDGVVYRRPKR